MARQRKTSAERAKLANMDVGKEMRNERLAAVAADFAVIIEEDYFDQHVDCECRACQALRAYREAAK